MRAETSRIEDVVQPEPLRRWRTVYLGGPHGSEPTRFKLHLERLASLGIDVEFRFSKLTNSDGFPSWTELVLLNIDFAGHPMQDIGVKEAKSMGVPFVRIGFDWSRTVEALRNARIIPRPLPPMPRMRPLVEVVRLLSEERATEKRRWTQQDREGRSAIIATTEILLGRGDPETVDPDSLPEEVLDAMTAPTNPPPALPEPEKKKKEEPMTTTTAAVTAALKPTIELAKPPPKLTRAERIAASVAAKVQVDQTTLRMPLGLRHRLDEICARHDLPLSALIVGMIEDVLAEGDKE